MKKLMTLMLGMALAFSCVSVSFAAQDAPKKTKKNSKKKAPKKKSGDKN